MQVSDLQELVNKSLENSLHLRPKGALPHQPLSIDASLCNVVIHTYVCTHTSVHHDLLHTVQISVLPRMHKAAHFCICLHIQAWARGNSGQRQRHTSRYSSSWAVSWL